MADDTSGTEKKSRRKVGKPSGKMFMAWLVILALLAGGGYFAYKYYEAKDDVDRLSNPQESARAEAQEIVNKVDRSIELPRNETPTVATVTDVSKLKGQAFFAKAQNGDKVLIYTEARRAILYRPSTDKVIEIAPINIGNTQNTSQDDN